MPIIARNTRFLLPTLTLYALFVGAIVHYHEPWRDEADSWLAARDLSVAEMFRFSGYVGSPATWHLVLAPFAKLAAPYATLGWINAVIAVAAAGVFLALAPLPKVTRVLVVFSYCLAYEYAVVARNYSLLALALFATAALYARRGERPVGFALAVCFLFNTTAHGAVLAAVIAAAVAWQWLRDRPVGKRRFGAIALMFVGATVAAAQLWPAGDSQRPEFFVLRSAGAVVDVLTRAIAVPVGSPLLDPLWLVVNLVVLLAAGAYFARWRIVLVVWLGGMLALFYVFAFKWVVPERHAGIVLLWLIFTLWIARAHEPPMDAQTSPARAPSVRGRVTRAHVALLLSIALVPACVRTVLAAVDDVRYEYSHARQMGEFIVAHDLDRGRPIAATNLAESVIPYLRVRQVWNVHTRRWQSHQPWDRNFQGNWFLLGAQVWERVEEQFPPDRRPHVLCEWPLPYPAEHGYRLLHRTQGRVPPTKEVFYLYTPIEAAATFGSASTPAMSPALPTPD